MTNGTAGDIYEVLGSLRMALAQLKLYPKASPQVTKVAGGVYQALAGFLDAHDVLTLATTPEGALANGKRMTSKDAGQATLETSLQAGLLEAGIRSFRISRGISLEELVTFLYALGHKFWELRDGKAINGRLLEEGVRNATVDEVEYVAVGKKDVVLKDAASTLEQANLTPKEFLDALDGRLETASLDGTGSAMRAELVLRLLRQDPGVIAALHGQDSPTGLVADAVAPQRFPDVVRVLGLLAKAAESLPDGAVTLRPVTDTLLEPFRVHALLRPSMKAALGAVAPAFIPPWMEEDLPPGTEPGVVRRLRDIQSLTPAVRSEAVSREGKSLLREALSIGREDVADEVVVLLAAGLTASESGQRRAASEALASVQEALGGEAAKRIREKLEAQVREVLDQERDPRAYAALAGLAGALVETRLRKGEVKEALTVIDILKRHATLKDAQFPERARLAMPAMDRVTSGEGWKAVAGAMKKVDPSAERLQRAVDRAAIKFLVSELKSIESLQERLRVAETVTRLGDDGIRTIREEALTTRVPSEALRLLEVIPAALPASEAEDILRDLIQAHPVISVKRRAAVLLAEKGFTRAAEILDASLKEAKEPAARGALVEALGHLKERAGLAALLEIADSRAEADDVRAVACAALARTSADAAVPVLLELAARPARGFTRLLRGTSAVLRAAATKALGAFPDVEIAHQALRAAANDDPEPTVKAAATVALQPPPAKPAPAPAPAATPAPSVPSGLSGLLAEMPLETLCQSLSNASRSGTLRVNCEAGQGFIYFDRGQVVAINFGSVKDVDALRALLEIHSGAFSFRSGELPSERRMSMSVQKLLLEAMRPADGPEATHAA